jgi:hypothetical protein
MIELRWLERNVQIPIHGSELLLNKTERILQQRRTVLRSFDGPHETWTEWQDVPVVVAP